MELHFERPTAATTIAVQVQGGKSFSAGTILPSSDHASSIRHDDIQLLTRIHLPSKVTGSGAAYTDLHIFHSVQER